MVLKPETIREIEKLATEMGQAFSPPEFIPGCEVLSISDKDQYATNNGWIEAICGQHNNQRCRWKGKFSGVQVGDYVDVLYFKSVQLFEVFAKGGSGNVSGLPITTNGDLLGYSTLPDRYPVSGNDGFVLTEDSTADFGFAWAEPAGGGWPYTNVLTVDPTNSNANYTTITLAIAGATAGDAIWIGNATYSENVTVNKKLYLIGASREGVIIDGTFTTTTADCVIENLTIYNDTAGAGAVNCYTAGADAIFRNVTIDGTDVTTTGALNGVYNVGAYEVTLDDCEVLAADSSSSNTAGVYVDNASAIVNIIGGKVDAPTSGGTASDLEINANGVINLRDVELANNVIDAGSGTINGQYTTDGALYSLDDLISTNDVYPESSTNGINARFENMWGDDVPADLYRFTARSFVTDNDAGGVLGFETSENPITPSAPFSVSIGASCTAESSTYPHWARINNASVANSVYLQWTSAVGITSMSALFAVSPYTPILTDSLIAELRLWDVQAPGALDEYFALRFRWMAATYPLSPMRIGTWYGTGVTFALADGTAVGTASQLPYNSGDPLQIVITTNATPVLICVTSQADGYQFLGDGVAPGATWPTSFKTIQWQVFPQFNSMFIDQINVG